MDNYDFNNSPNENRYQNSRQQQQYYYQQQPQFYQQAPTPNQQTEKNKNKSTVIIICIAIVALIAAFFVVRSLSNSVKADNDTTFESTSTSSQASTTAPTTQETTTMPVITESITTTETTAPTTVAQSTTQADTVPVINPTTDTTVPVSTTPTTEEILQAISNGINSLKDPSANFVGTKAQVIDINLTDCSVSALTEPVNTVLKYFMGEETFTFDFTNGNATDPETGETITSAQAIPPTDKPFTLTKDGIAEAKFEQVGDNKVYTIKLVPESSNLSSPRPVHHNSACDTLDFSAFELPMGEVTKADFEYPGAEISVTIDANGKIIEYHENLPMKGTGEGKLGITASGSMEGYIDEKWTIQWK